MAGSFAMSRWSFGGTLFARSTFAAALSLLAAGCQAPLIVECGSGGRFVRSEGEAWCLFSGSSTTRCPSLLSFSHALPWGERGCAAARYDPIPEALCAAAGRCGDGGQP
jgi:hypothetical protein